MDAQGRTSTEPDEVLRTAECPLCFGDRLEEVYERRLGGTSSLGRGRIRLTLCADCGLLFQNPSPSRAALAAHYRSASVASGAVWHETGADSWRGGHNVDRAAFVRRLVGRDDVSGRLLDVGCGGGEFLEHLAPFGKERIGLEPNAKAADRARARGFEVIESTLEANALPSSSFALVTSVSCLEHVGSVHESAAALARLVAPGGLLFVEVPDSCRPIAQAAEFYSLEHVTHFTPGTLQRLLAAHGFAPVLFERAIAPAIRIGARRVADESSPSLLTLPDDRDELRHALRRYVVERTALGRELSQRLTGHIARARQASAKLAIYGAGDHTRFLLDLVDFEGCVTAVLDSDPAKEGESFLGWPVHAPEDLPRLGVTAVVLSSRPFQEEMASRIAATCATHGIEIVRCYPEARSA